MRLNSFFFTAVIFLTAGHSFAQSGIIDASDANAYVSTDKCAYKPGDTVVFRLSRSMNADVKVRYKHLDEKLGDMSLKQSTWVWKVPPKDYTGYLVELYTSVNGKEKIIATVGVDVSSDWKKFPRYGFVSSYQQMSSPDAERVVDDLNRFHINGLQFYDWHYKHHQPLAGTIQNPDTVWKDIGGREIYGTTIRNYIKAAHDRKMKAMFYNLVYGTFKNAEQDGVSPEWYLYTDKNHQNQEKFDLPEPPFASDLFLTDPSNTGWQQYLTQQNRKVYRVYDFDGYQMDQLGNRDRDLFKYDGSKLELNKSFESFVNGIKNNEQEKSVVMNAVNQYGQEGIAKTGVDFLYTEVWPPNEGFDGLAKILLENDSLCHGSKGTALTAYIHFAEGKGKKGFFNTPAVLLADAVIFAFGGSHLEMGEHLIEAPYFPEHNLEMKEGLKGPLLHYYDFLVAYQNLLRDGGTFNRPSLEALGKMKLNNWPPKTGEVSYVGKEFEKRQVIHLINFKGASTLEWRDVKQIQNEPQLLRDVRVSLKTNDKQIAKVWFASPDVNNGSSQPINFKKGKGQISFTLPSLKYWDMIVVDYQ